VTGRATTENGAADEAARADAPGDAAGARALVGDLFRRESAHLVAALARLLGPSNLALAEDVVGDALVSAVQAWRFGLPDDPKAWILAVARNRAIDVLRREKRLAASLPALASDAALAGAVDAALSPEADAGNQLAMMFAICDGALAPETHVTLVLRLLCGLSAAEIARAFLVDVGTIDRRLHRGRARLEALGELRAPADADEVRARQPSVEQALYLLFNEGYHGSGSESPLRPAMCADAIRLAEILAGGTGVEPASAHALAALFCLHAARLATRLDAGSGDEGGGAFVPLAEQDRTLWNASLVDRGVRHLAASATGDRLGRWHLEAGIAFEHTSAPSLAATRWERIVAYYDALVAVAPGPVVAMNRALAIAELRGLDAGRDALAALAADPRLAAYSFYWAARADVERRAPRPAEAIRFYERAASLARTPAERVTYERRLRELGATSA
jgi:RNA polymerase sigma factor (sigma-70 family)